MPQFTKKAIIDSVLRLGAEKPINKVTVKDVVNDCGITRNTFYYYFRDIYDVLESVINAEVGKLDIANGSYAEYEQAFFGLTQFIYDHKKTLVNLYNSIGHEKTEKYLSDRLRSTVLTLVRREAAGLNATESDLQIISIFYEQAILGVLIKWLKNELPDDLGYVMERVEKIFAGQVRSTIESSVKNR